MRQESEIFSRSAWTLRSRNYPIALCLYSVLSPAALGADASGWEKISLAGETMCADGSPYSIFVHRGSSNKLVLDFMGGGACWSAETCGAINATYSRKVPDVIGKWLPSADGIYDRTRSENPFRNDTHVMVPYCTGDVHWGSDDHLYNSPNTGNTLIHHRGAINAKAALDQTLAQLATNPSQVFVTGCSAGAYGAIWWTPYIKKLFPQSKMIELGDSGAGILSEAFRRNGFQNWKIERSIPRWIPGLDLADDEVLRVTMPQLYGAISKELPNVRFSQFNALNDIIQRYFYKEMGGNQFTWSGQLRQGMNESGTLSRDFTYYISPWDTHCIIPYAEFYGDARTPQQNQSFPAWFDSVLNSNTPINEPCADCAEE